MNKRVVLLSLFATTLMYGQDGNVFSNSGQIFVEPNTEVSVFYDFVNANEGEILNNGEVHFYKNFKNDGTFDFDNRYKSGKTFFQKSNYFGVISPVKTISGEGISRFYDVIFDRQKENNLLRSFDLLHSIQIFNSADFKNGVVKVEKAQGGFVKFLNEATHNLEMNRTLGDNSHIEGEVTKVGNQDFIFPIGKNNGTENLYRFSAISSPDNQTAVYSSEYFLQDSEVNQITGARERLHENKASSIKTIDPVEFWTVKQEDGTKGSVQVTVSWDERTTPANLLEDKSLLRIVRWDDTSETWIDEGGFVDVVNKTVTTSIPSGQAPIDAKGFGIFTLATMKPELKNGVIFYNGVSVNNDGKNDYFGIDNLSFPDNRLRIFNRWGRLVYETENYDTKGNVFRGFAESGSLVLDKGKKLPTGTYYYLFEYKDKQGEIQKHTGWLYLKSDNEVSF